MSHNAFPDTKSNEFRATAAPPQDQAQRTRSHRPQTDGTVERYQQTMAREWAYGPPL